MQLSDPDDRDALRFSLTGEGGLNDGTASPMLMLGLGLMGLHAIGTLGWRWLVVASVVVHGVSVPPLMARYRRQVRRNPPAPPP